MDFHSMKRKELQALCKKHNIPANSTNLAMANNLSSLLKEKEKQVARGKSCLRSAVEQPSETLSDGVNRQSKKVRFSPENDTIEFLKSEVKPVELGRGARTRSMLRSVGKIEDIVSEKNVGNVKFPRDAVPDAAMRKRLKRGSRYIVGEPVPTVEARALTRRSLENKEVESNKEAKDDALLRKNPTKRTSRKSGTNMDEEVSEIETASRKKPGEVNNVVLKKNQSQRTSRSRVVKTGHEFVEEKGTVEDDVIVESQKVVRRSKRNMKQIEDLEMMNLGLGEIKVVRRERTKKQHDQLLEDVRVTDATLRTAIDLEGENNILVNSTTFEENVRTRKSSLRCKSIDAYDAIPDKNDTKKKPKSGKREPILEENNVVIEESTLVEEGPRRSSRNSNRRQTLMPQTEKMGADGSKGRNGNNTLLKSSDFEQKAKSRSSRHKSIVVSDTVLAENVGKNKSRSRRLDPVLEKGNDKIEGSSLVEEPIRKSMRNGATVQKTSMTVKTGKAVTKRKLHGSTEEPNAQSEPVEEIIPVVEQLFFNSQPTMADIGESSNSPVTNCREVLSDNAVEETQEEIRISRIETDTKIEVGKINLSQDCAANEDNFDSNNLGLVESVTELNVVKHLVPPEASLGDEDCSQIDLPDCTAKLDVNLDLEELEMDENNEVGKYTDSSSAMSHDEFDAESSYGREAKHFVEPEAVLDTSDGEKNTPSEVKVKEKHEAETVLVSEVIEFSVGKLQPSVEIEGEGDIEHNVAGDGPEASSLLHTLVKKDIIPTTMEVTVSDEVENPPFIEPEHGKELMHDFENEDHSDQDSGSTIKEKFELVNKEDEDYSLLGSSERNRITASKVEHKQRDEVEISPLGSELLEFTNSISPISLVKGETMVGTSVTISCSAIKVPTVADIKSVLSPSTTSRNIVSNLREQKHSIGTATPNSVSNEIRSLMLVNLDRTPASEFRKVHNLVLQEGHATSAVATAEPVEDLNKVMYENTSGGDRHSPLPQKEHVDFDTKKLDLSLCMENLIASQEAHNSGELSKILNFGDGCSAKTEESDEAETKFDADYNTVTAENETQPFEETSPQTSGSAESQDVTESLQSPSDTGINNASSLKEQKCPIRIATPLSVANEIESLMLVNLDRTPASELRKVHKLMLQEDHATSFVTDEPVEDLNKITNENTTGVHHHSPFPQEDHTDKPSHPFTLCDNFEMENPESGMCVENLIGSLEAHNAGEQRKNQRFGDDYSTELEESDGAETEFDADYNSVSADDETQPFEEISPRTTSGRAEHEGYVRSNIEVSPTELRLLFDDEKAGDGIRLNSTSSTAPPSVRSGLLTGSKDADEINKQDICLGNNFDTEEENRNVVTEEELQGPTERKDEDRKVIGSYDNSFVDTACVKRRVSPSTLAYSASASKSIHKLLEEENEGCSTGIMKMVSDHGHENATRVTNVPGASDILAAENAEETVTSSIRGADFIEKHRDRILKEDVNNINPKALRPINFESIEHKVTWELSDDTSTALVKLTTEIEDEDLVNVSTAFEGNVTQVDDGMFDDFDDHEMQMVQEMFQAEEVDSPSYSDYYSGREIALVEENAHTSIDNSLEEDEMEMKQNAINHIANNVSTEASDFEECVERSQKLTKRTEVADESYCHKSSFKNTVQCFVESNEYAEKQNLSQASQSFLPDPDFGHSQASFDSNMHSSWEFNLLSETEATKSTPVISRVPLIEEDENVFVFEKQLDGNNPFVDRSIDIFVASANSFLGDKTSKGANKVKEFNDDVLGESSSRLHIGDETIKEVSDFSEAGDDSLLEENIARSTVEATEPCETEIRSDSLIEDTPSESGDRVVDGGNAAEDLAIDTDPLDKQEKLKSNECDGELGTGAAAEVMEVDVFENQGLTVSSLFSSEGNSTGVPFSMECKYVEASEQVASDTTWKETHPPEHSEELIVEAGDTLAKEPSVDDIVQFANSLAEHTEVQKLSQDFTPNTTGDDVTVASPLFDQGQPLEFANLAMKEDSGSEDIVQNVDLADVENAFGKEEQGEMSVSETNSTIVNMKKHGSLIRRTPKKLANNFDMKENATSIKRENLGSVTAKSTARRRALMELPK